MNRTYLKALGLAFGLASSAMCFADGLGWVGYCDDPTTTPSNYSTDYGGHGVGTDLFAAVMPGQGTAKYELCFNPAFTGDGAGGIEFNIGDLGSVQTTQDDFTELTMGGGFVTGTDENGNIAYGPAGTRSDWSYMGTVRQDDGKDPSIKKFGKTGAIDTYYDGSSDRYFIAQSTQDNIRITLRIDAVGDAARLQWTMVNLAGATNIGMWFGHYVNPIDNFRPFQPKPIRYINVPGYKPLEIQRRFQRNPNLDPNGNPREYPLPDYVDFYVSQARAWEGLRVLNSPSTASNATFPDQTPVDGFDIGLAGWILGGEPGNTEIFPDIMENDVATNSAFIQKWNPQPVAASTTPVDERTVQIVAYYKTTWGDDNMDKPYAIVIDSPKVIGVQDGNPFQFVRSPATVRVYLDNIRGYTTTEKTIAIQNAQVTLTLPEGLSDANDSTRRVITKTISDIEPRRIKFVDFQIQASPTAFGTLQMQVQVIPQPGPTKIVTSSITIASQPYLQLTQNANLVGSPWVYGSNNWAQILSPMEPDIDYQSFGWNSATQEYTVSTSPHRGNGYFIISAADQGFKQLGGSPTTPQDLSTGAPLITLNAGWNLIANPYNYPIILGQFVGVPGSDNANSYTYQELIDRGTITPSLASWDPGTQSYKFIGNATDTMQPNTGYWVNVLDPQGLTLSYPAVYLPFVPSGTGGITGNEPTGHTPRVKDVTALWTSNMVVSNGLKVDRVNTFGFVADGQSVKKGLIYEPPAAPLKDAIYSAFRRDTKATGTTMLARVLTQEGPSRTFNLDVISSKKGTVTVTWPEIANVPAQYDVILRDDTAGVKVDMRSTSNYRFAADAKLLRELHVIVKLHADQIVSGIDANRVGPGHNDPLAVTYKLAVPAKVTVQIYNLSTGRMIQTVADGVQQDAGKQQTLWNLLNDKGNRVAKGSYQATVTADDGETTNTKKVSFSID